MISKAKPPPNENEILNNDNAIGSVQSNESETLHADCNNVRTTSCQTIAVEYFRKSEATQTKRSMLSTTKGTQTLLTVTSLTNLLVQFPQTTFTGSQTEPPDNVIDECSDNFSKTNECEARQQVGFSKTKEPCTAHPNAEISETPPKEPCEFDCDESFDKTYCSEFDNSSDEESRIEDEFTKEKSEQNGNTFFCPVRSLLRIR